MWGKKSKASPKAWNKMSNKTVLYRKYRPQSFEEVLGQDHIVSILKKLNLHGNQRWCCRDFTKTERRNNNF